MTSPKKQPLKRTIDQVEEERDDETKLEEKEVNYEAKAGEVADDAPANNSEGKAETASKKAMKKAKLKESKEDTTKSVSKRATRSSAKSASSKYPPKAIIQFLLSDEAIAMLDQLETDKTDDFQFPRDRLNPFQDLIAACMVSKPFSHRVATRAINDLFSKSNSLTSPQEVLDFGRDKVLESLHRSKTLHKDKTTGQIIGIAEVCQSGFNGDSSLDALREQASRDPTTERDLIVKSFKGYGPKTVDIFFRRVQVEWEEVYPFADDATIKAAKEVGLSVEDAEGLKGLVDAAMDEKDDKERRVAFGRIVDVLVYLGLEHKTEELGSRIGADVDTKD